MLECEDNLLEQPSQSDSIPQQVRSSAKGFTSWGETLRLLQLKVCFVFQIMLSCTAKTNRSSFCRVLVIAQSWVIFNNRNDPVEMYLTKY